MPSKKVTSTNRNKAGLTKRPAASAQRRRDRAGDPTPPRYTTPITNAGQRSASSQPPRRQIVPRPRRIQTPPTSSPPPQPSHLAEDSPDELGDDQDMRPVFKHHPDSDEDVEDNEDEDLDNEGNLSIRAKFQGFLDAINDSQGSMEL